MLRTLLGQDVFVVADLGGKEKCASLSNRPT